VAQAVSLPRTPTADHGRSVQPLAAAVVGIAAAAPALYLDLAHPAGRSPLVTGPHIGAGLTYVVVGAAARWRRPRNRIGQLMVAVGITWFVQDLTHSTWPLVFAPGDFFWVAYFGILGHLVVAFPSGRLETVTDRVIVGAAYLWAMVGNLFTQILFAPAGRSNRAIGERLLLSPKTVETHVSVIFSKLGIQDTSDDNRRVLSVLTWLRGDGDGPAPESS